MDGAESGLQDGDGKTLGVGSHLWKGKRRIQVPSIQMLMHGQKLGPGWDDQGRRSANELGWGRVERCLGFVEMETNRTLRRNSLDSKTTDRLLLRFPRSQGRSGAQQQHEDDARRFGDRLLVVFDGAAII